VPAACNKGHRAAGMANRRERTELDIRELHHVVLRAHVAAQRKEHPKQDNGKPGAVHSATLPQTLLHLR